MLTQIGEGSTLYVRLVFPGHEPSRTGCADNGLDC